MTEAINIFNDRKMLWEAISKFDKQYNEWMEEREFTSIDINELENDVKN